MISHGCPQWVNPEPDDKIPSIARGMSDFYRFIVRKAKTYILNVNDIKMWHGKIFESAVPLTYYAGNFRGPNEKFPCLQTEVLVGSRSGTPFLEVETRIQQFAKELNDFVLRTDGYMTSAATPPDRVKAAVQLAAFCSGRLLEIHPFINGNGRMARSAADYYLFRYGLPLPFWPAYPRPGTADGLSYEQASAACMVGNFSLLYEYLLRVEVDKLLEASRAKVP